MIPRDGELHRFIHRDLGSDEALQVLTLIAGEPGHKWTPEEVRARLQIEDAQQPAIATKRIELRLQDLWQNGLVTRDVSTGLYCYDSRDQGKHRLVTELLAMNGDELAAASRLAYIKPRTGAAAFADAFGSMRRTS